MIRLLRQLADSEGRPACAKASEGRPANIQDLEGEITWVKFINNNIMEEKRYLGIDWGEVRIGTSLGDNVLKIATPHEVVSGVDDILEIIKKEDIDEIILGQPLKMKNLDKKFHTDYLNFSENLKKSTDIIIHLNDERLSSKAADALLGDKKTKAARDAVAAMIILQSFLDSLVE